MLRIRQGVPSIDIETSLEIGHVHSGNMRILSITNENRLAAKKPDRYAFY